MFDDIVVDGYGLKLTFIPWLLMHSRVLFLFDVFVFIHSFYCIIYCDLI